MLMAVFINVLLITYCATRSVHALNSEYTKLDDGSSQKTTLSFPTSAKFPINRLTYQRTLFVLNGTMTNLRLTNVRACKNKDRVTVKVGEKTVRMAQSPILPCPWFYAPKCDMVGYFGLGDLPAVPSLLPQHAQILNSKGQWKALEMVDARIPLVKPHTLAVCLQPVYLMADWTMLPHFFESWIGQGATYFLIYIQTITPEFASLLQIYVDDRHNGIQVEIVPWSPFPEEGLNSEAPQNPNNQAYRTEVATSVNDCLLRSRAKAKYVVSSDMDEILVAMKGNETLLQLIDRYASQKLRKHKRTGAFVFRQSYAVAKNNFSSITHPSQFTFETYKNVKLTKKVWPAGSRSKVIMIPEAVKKTHVHDILGFENPTWLRVYMPVDEGRVFHFRQIGEGSILNDTYEESTHLSKMVDIWNDNFQERINRAYVREQGSTRDKHIDEGYAGHPSIKHMINDEKWPNRGKQVLNEIDVCRSKNYNIRSQQCVTQWSCKDKLGISTDDWITAESKWVTV